MNTGPWTAGIFVTRIIPQARRELNRWLTRARQISCPELREQAVASIVYKKFHVLGGSACALYLRSKARQYEPSVLQAIAAIQTISDYLDNLCDRTGICDERGFRRLHEAMQDALNPDSFDASRQQSPVASPPSAYYLEYPYSDDDGYLTELVQVCRANLASLPGYQSVRAHAQSLARLYCDLQSLKHLDPLVRKQRLESWAQREMGSTLASHAPGIDDQLKWWEFAAATGSTLGLFLLFAMAAEGQADGDTIDRTLGAYFPWICGLHILLDYLIDLEEDEMHGDFNFVTCYEDESHRRQRLAHFVRESMSRARNLQRPGFHLMIIRGLLALYLSDQKVKATGLEEEARVLCSCAGSMASLMRLSCMGLRRLGVF